MPNASGEIRRAVRRRSADQYLLIALVSFGSTIIVTRVFLELTGYPRIETGTLHIAHVLWGGLFMFVAALFPLLYANRWALFLSALLNGVGFGLFMDEVGKFITQTNDYFYPPAAPIIYAVVLLVAIVYLQVRRPKKPSPREGLYQVLGQMEELLDNDLEVEEKIAMRDQLIEIQRNCQDDPNLQDLANSLATFIESDKIKTVEDHEGKFVAFFHRQFNKIGSFLNEFRFRVLLILGLGASGVYSTIKLINLVYYGFLILRGRSASLFFNPADFPFINSPTWILIRFAIQGAIGICSIIAVVLLILKKDNQAIVWATTSLILSLTVVNILVFYLDQFSATLGALFELLLLLAVMTFKRKYVPLPKPDY